MVCKLIPTYCIKAPELSLCQTWDHDTSWQPGHQPCVCVSPRLLCPHSSHLLRLCRDLGGNDRVATKKIKKCKNKSKFWHSVSINSYPFLVSCYWGIHHWQLFPRWSKMSPNFDTLSIMTLTSDYQIPPPPISFIFNSASFPEQNQ